jgi:AAA family ATP:ADP antiporter
MSSPAVALPFNRKRSLIDSALSLVTDIRKGERATALMMAANMFIVLSTYYVLKTVREALILSEGGANVKSYSSAAQALLLLLVVPFYGAIASRFKRGTLIAGTTIFFIANLLIFYLAGITGMQIGVSFFLWVGIFNLMITAQFWAFANDIYTPEQGQRLMPMIGIGSSLGAWAGATATGSLLSIFNPYQLMLFAAAGLALATGLSIFINRRESRGTQRAQEEPLSKEGGFKLVMKSRYLLLIAGMMLVLNVVNSTGEFILGKMVVDTVKQQVATGAIAAADTKTSIGQFYASFYGWVNLLGLVLQVFVVSRLFKYVGVRGALFFLPAFALAGYSLIAAIPLLAIVRVGKILENGTDYSIQNTARHALFLTTSREEKYKAKAAIDSFFWRAGDMVQAGIVLLGSALAFSIHDFALVNIGLTLVWVGIVVMIYREHQKQEANLSSIAAGQTLQASR